MTANLQSNRRVHERFRLQPMYTSVVARRQADLRAWAMDGHAYDISESGARIELDESIHPGQPLELRLGLPGSDAAIEADADVVWVNDESDDPGPRRMAVRFTRFHSANDHQRLLKYLGAGANRAAA